MFFMVGVGFLNIAMKQGKYHRDVWSHQKVTRLYCSHREGTQLISYNLLFII